MLRNRRYVTGLAIAAFSLLFAPSARAQALGLPTHYWSFDDAPNSPGVYFNGGGGYDIGKGYGYDGGANNLAIWAWEPNTWNAVNIEFTPGLYMFPLQDRTSCDITAEVETSPGELNNVFLDAWSVRPDGEPWTRLLHQAIGSTSTPEGLYYETINASISINTAGAPPGDPMNDVVMDFGWWGTGSVQWIRVDNVLVTCEGWRSPG